MKNYCLFFAVFLAYSPIFSQSNTWKALNGPSGIAPNAATITTLGHLYVKHSKGIVRSLDDGKTWENINTPTVTGPNLMSLPDGSVLTIGNGKIYKIAPGEKLWTVTGNVYADKFTLNPQGHLFIVENSGEIRRSTDGGQTFSVFSDRGKFTGLLKAIYFFGNGDNFVMSYESSQNFLWRVSDDGTLVEQVAAPVTIHETKMVRHPSGKLFLWSPFRGAYFSTTGGKTWEPLSIASSTQSNTDLLYCAPSGLLYAETSNRLYVSDNGGTTWAKTNAWFENDYFIVCSPSSDLSLIGGRCGYYGQNGLHLSRDNWKTFQSLNGQFDFSEVGAIQKDRKGRLYALVCSEYFVSNDDGQNWAPFSINGGAPNNLLFTKAGHGFARGQNGLWYISKDHGDTWEFCTGIFTDAPQLRTIQEAPDGTLYGLNDDETFKSVDFGESWRFVAPNWWPFNSFWIHPNGAFYSFNSNTINVSWDEGRTWQTIQVGNIPTLTIQSLHVTRQGLIIFNAGDFGGYTTYISTDGGITFAQLPPPSAATFIPKIFSNDAGDIFIAAQDSLYISKNLGKKWTAIGGKLPLNQSTSSSNFQYSLSAFYCDEQNYLYLGFQGAPIHKSEQPVSYPNLVRGRAFSDSNTNCTFETGETLRPFQLLKATGNTEYYRVSKLDGAFALDLPDGQYTVSAVPPSPIWDACPPTVVNLVAGQADSARVDLGLKTLAHCADLKVGLSTAFLRRCFSNAYYLHISNEGNAPASGVAAVVTLDTLMEYESANFPLRAQQGQTFTFDIGDLPAGQARVLKIQLKISCDADLGQMHCISAELTPQPNCSVALPAHHTARECRPNQGAYDPNDKQAFANGLPLTGKVPPNTELEYLIRFQNTGTDTAFTVAVSDRLSPKLDLQSVRPGVSSHPYRYEIREDRTLRFIFDNIALPDSNTNEPASHGFVKFSVKPIATVPLGDKIANVADIYFDFNAPVRTNTVDLTVELPTATREPAPALHCLVSPNPARDAFTVQWERNGHTWSGNLQLELFDATGRAALRQTASGTQTTVSRGELPSGLYWLKVTATDGSFARAKVVLE